MIGILSIHRIEPYFKPKFDILHYVNYLSSLDYPLNIINTFKFDSLYELMLRDKKNDQQGVQMVLLEGIEILWLNMSINPL